MQNYGKARQRTTNTSDMRKRVDVLLETPGIQSDRYMGNCHDYKADEYSLCYLFGAHICKLAFHLIWTKAFRRTKKENLKKRRAHRHVSISACVAVSVQTDNKGRNAAHQGDLDFELTCTNQLHSNYKMCQCTFFFASFPLLLFLTEKKKCYWLVNESFKLCICIWDEWKQQNKLVAFFHFSLMHLTI